MKVERHLTEQRHPTACLNEAQRTRLLGVLDKGEQAGIFSDDELQAMRHFVGNYTDAFSYFKETYHTGDADYSTYRVAFRVVRELSLQALNEHVTDDWDNFRWVTQHRRPGNKGMRQTDEVKRALHPEVISRPVSQTELDTAYKIWGYVFISTNPTASEQLVAIGTERLKERVEDPRQPQQKPIFVEANKSALIALLGMDQSMKNYLFDYIVSALAHTEERINRSASASAYLTALSRLFWKDQSLKHEDLISLVHNILGQQPAVTCPENWKAAKQVYDVYPELFGVVATAGT